MKCGSDKRTVSPNKTTTLIQVADAIHAIGRAAALFVPLGEWSSQDQGFLTSVLQRPAFRDRTESDLQQLVDRFHETDHIGCDHSSSLTHVSQQHL
jgi:hypothetical protein